MRPGDDLFSRVDTDELLGAVADFVSATAWSGRNLGYAVPTTHNTVADQALGRAAELLSSLPGRYSTNFSIIADRALQGAVDTRYADQVDIVGSEDS